VGFVGLLAEWCWKWPPWTLPRRTLPRYLAGCVVLAAMLDAAHESWRTISAGQPLIAESAMDAVAAGLQNVPSVGSWMH
jgi:hypothetical protein